MIQLVPLSPLDKTGYLIPFVTERIIEFSRQHMDEMTPEIYARAVLSKLLHQPNDILVLARVGAKGDVVGHGIASMETDGIKRRVFVSQCRVDPGEGSSDPTTVRRCIEYTEQWGSERGATDLLMSTARSDESRYARSS